MAIYWICLACLCICSICSIIEMKFMQGSLSGQRQGQPVFITKLEVCPQLCSKFFFLLILIYLSFAFHLACLLLYSCIAFAVSFLTMVIDVILWQLVSSLMCNPDA